MARRVRADQFNAPRVIGSVSDRTVTIEPGQTLGGRASREPITLRVRAHRERTDRQLPRKSRTGDTTVPADPGLLAAMEDVERARRAVEGIRREVPQRPRRRRGPQVVHLPTGEIVEVLRADQVDPLGSPCPDGAVRTMRRVPLGDSWLMQKTPAFTTAEEVYIEARPSPGVDDVPSSQGEVVSLGRFEPGSYLATRYFPGREAPARDDCFYFTFAAPLVCLPAEYEHVTIDPFDYDAPNGQFELALEMYLPVVDGNTQLGPLVIIMPGRVLFEPPEPLQRQYFDLMECLVSHGFIAATVGFDPLLIGPSEKADYFVAYVDFIPDLLESLFPGQSLTQFPDGRRYALLGHSTGAEAVPVAIRRIEATFPPGSPIREVGAAIGLAPGDTFGGTIDNLWISRFLVISGTLDGDVDHEKSVFDYDSVRDAFVITPQSPAFKSLVTIDNANHWGFADATLGDEEQEFNAEDWAKVISRETQQVIAFHYVLAMLRWKLYDERQHADWFNGFLRPIFGGLADLDELLRARTKILTRDGLSFPAVYPLEIGVEAADGSGILRSVDLTELKFDLTSMSIPHQDTYFGGVRVAWSEPPFPKIRFDVRGVGGIYIRVTDTSGDRQALHLDAIQATENDAPAGVPIAATVRVFRRDPTSSTAALHAGNLSPIVIAAPQVFTTGGRNRSTLETHLLDFATLPFISGEPFEVEYIELELLADAGDVIIATPRIWFYRP